MRKAVMSAMRPFTPSRHQQDPAIAPSEGLPLILLALSSHLHFVALARAFHTFLALPLSLLTCSVWPAILNAGLNVRIQDSQGGVQFWPEREDPGLIDESMSRRRQQRWSAQSEGVISIRPSRHPAAHNPGSWIQSFFCSAFFHLWRGSSS